MSYLTSALAFTACIGLVTVTGCAGASQDDSGPNIDDVGSELTANTVGANQGIMWGVNAHPIASLNKDSTSIYAHTITAQQFRQMRAIGLRHYRMDLYNAADDQFGLLTSILSDAKFYGIVVTPILISRGGSTPDAAYASAYATGKGYASRFSKDIHVWELGNEENGNLFPPFSDGSDPATFKSAANYSVVQARMRGLIDGVRAGDPTARVAVGDAGGCNYGFTQALWNDGLRWDITLFHPYDFWGDIDNRGSTGTHCAKGDNMLAKHSAFGKPIWLTEFSYTPAVNNPNKTSLGKGIVSMMTKFASLAKQYDIEVADVYELYDENQQSGAEAHFGIYGDKTQNTDAAFAIGDYTYAHPSLMYR